MRGRVAAAAVLAAIPAVHHEATLKAIDAGGPPTTKDLSPELAYADRRASYGSPRRRRGWRHRFARKCVPCVMGQGSQAVHRARRAARGGAA